MAKGLTENERLERQANRERRRVIAALTVDLLQNLGYSQREISEKIGCHQLLISHWQRVKPARPPTIQELKLARGLIYLVLKRCNERYNNLARLIGDLK
jgi:transcriptional regulator with XRE-family HTH domain